MTCRSRVRERLVFILTVVLALAWPGGCADDESAGGDARPGSSNDAVPPDVRGVDVSTGFDSDGSDGGSPGDVGVAADGAAPVGDGPWRLVEAAVGGGRGVQACFSGAAPTGGPLVVAGLYQGDAVFGTDAPLVDATGASPDAWYPAGVFRAEVDGDLSWAWSEPARNPSRMALSPGGAAAIVVQEPLPAQNRGAWLVVLDESGAEQTQIALAADGDPPYESYLSAHPDGGFVAAFDINGYGLPVLRWTNGETVDLAEGRDDCDQCAYLLRLDEAGELLWYRVLTGEHVVGVTSLTVLRGGDIVVGGLFAGTTTFGAGEATEATLTDEAPDWRGSAFVVRLAPDGTQRWVARSRGPEEVYPHEILEFDDGRLVMVAGITGPAAFGEEGADVAIDPGYTPEQLGYADQRIVLALVGLSAGGAPLWTTTIAGPGTAVRQPRSLAIGTLLVPLGDRFLVRGSLSDRDAEGEWVTFGRGQPGETTMEAPAEGARRFLAVYDGDGTLRDAGDDPTEIDGRASEVLVPLADGTLLGIGYLAVELTVDLPEGPRTLTPEGGRDCLLLTIGADPLP